MISSINGGLGSGLTLDLAYTLKLLMQERGFDHGELTGHLIHAVDGRTQDVSLSAANGLAFLSELRHFAESGYPGDPTLGLPPVEDETPFDWAYVTRLSHDLGSAEFDQELDNLAHYLDLSSVTPCHQFLDQSRKLEQKLDHYALRTFGLSQWGLAPKRLGRYQLATVADLFEHWLRGDEALQEAVPTDIDAIFKDLGLSVDDVMAKVHGLTQRVPDAIPHFSIESQIEPLLDSKDDPFARLKSQWDRALPLSGGGLATPEASARMQTFVQAQGGDLGDQLRDWVLESLAGASLGLFTARARASQLLAKLREADAQLLGWRQSCQEQQRDVATMLREIPLTKAKTPGNTRTKLENVVEAYSQQRMAEECFCAGRQLYQTLIEAVDETQQWLDEANQRIGKLESKLVLPPPAEANEEEHPLERWFDDTMSRNRDAHRQTVEMLVTQELIQPHGTWVEVLQQPEFWQSEFLEGVLDQAHRVVVDAGQQISLGQILKEAGIESADWVQWLEQQFAQAQPTISDCGGSLRLMTATPRGSQEDTLGALVEEQFSKHGATIRGTRGEFVMCVEGEDLSLAHLAYRMLQVAPQAADLAKRVHTRKDVNWASLDSLL